MFVRACVHVCVRECAYVRLRCTRFCSYVVLTIACVCHICGAYVVHIRCVCYACVVLVLFLEPSNRVRC